MTPHPLLILTLTDVAQAAAPVTQAVVDITHAAASVAQQATQTGDTPLPPFEWTTWSGGGVLRAALLMLVGVYLLGIGPLRRRYQLGPPASWTQIACYMGGVLCLLLVLEGPIHVLSDYYLFSAHMVQHMVLIYAAPPLMLLGTPDWLVRPLIKRPGVFRVARLLTNPFAALLTFNLVFALYHIPPYYLAVVENEKLHRAAHLLFIALAMQTWWPLLSPLPELPRLSYPLRMIYVFAQTLPGFIVGSFITNARTVLYPFYAEAPRVWGLTPQADQQLGGLIMWVFGGFYLLLIYSAIFFAWARAEGVHDDVAVPIRPRRVVPTPQPNGAARSQTAPMSTSAGTDGGANGASPLDEATTGGASTPTSRASEAPAEAAEHQRAPVSPRDLGARHVVTSAPDRSRLN